MEVLKTPPFLLVLADKKRKTRKIMRLSPVEANVTELLKPTIEHMGFRLVRVKLSGGEGGQRILQVMIERTNGVDITVDDCAEVSYTASALLDVNEPVSGAYRLEVSSPGIDRPLMEEDDFNRFSGFDAKVETAHPIDGRKRFSGTLGTTKDGKVVITVDQKEWQIPFDAIQSAKLIITDALLKAHQKQQQHA
ncbi:MAG: ribosome maturation factor RimP [Rickettsiales bacterium]